jgi:hypothetical protein
MSASFPTWLSVILVVVAAVDAYLLTQTSVVLTPIVALIAGAVQVAIAALLAFQKATTNAVRSMQGKPKIA